MTLQNEASLEGDPLGVGVSMATRCIALRFSKNL